MLLLIVQHVTKQWNAGVNHSTLQESRLGWLNSLRKEFGFEFHQTLTL